MTTLERVLSPVPTHLTRQQRSDRTAALFAEAASCHVDQDVIALHDEVLHLNIGVAHAVAHRFRNRGVDVQDLEQVACEALIKSVRRFDPSRERDFLSFAVPTIRGEVQRHFRDLGWMVRPTRRVQETQWRAVREEERLTSELGRPPTTAEIVLALDVAPAEYAEAQSAHGCFVPTSLDQPLTPGGEGADLGSTLPADDSGMTNAEARVMMFPLIRGLSRRERLVVYLRYFEDLSQIEIGAKIGVGQAQVSRILASALKTMRTAMGASDAA